MFNFILCLGMPEWYLEKKQSTRAHWFKTGIFRSFLNATNSTILDVQ